MCRLYLIPTGQTVWERQERLESSCGSPLTESSLQELVRLCGQLTGERVEAVYAGDAQAELQSAELVARTLGVRQRIEPDLHEVDYGLWQGLTLPDIRRRQPKLYRAWMEQPCCVRPPGGELFEEAAERLWQAVGAILRRHKHGAVALVLRPVMIALLRCRLDNLPMDGLWDLSARLSLVDVYDVNGSVKRLQTIGEPHGGA